LIIFISNRTIYTVKSFSGENQMRKKIRILFYRGVDAFVYVFTTFLVYLAYIEITYVSVKYKNIIFEGIKNFFLDLNFCLYSTFNKFLYLISFIFFIILVNFVSRKSFSKKSHIFLFNSFLFPSTYAIAIFGFFAISLFAVSFKDMFQNKIWTALLFSLISSAIIFLISFALLLIKALFETFFFKLKEKAENENHIIIEKKIDLEVSDEKSKIEFSELITWIEKNDDDHDGIDYFNTEQRFKHFIIDNIKKHKNFILFGEFGIGKTWLIERAKKQLEDEYIFCRIDSWGRNLGILSQQILSKMIYEASKYIDVTHLSCVPEKYQGALAKTGSFFDLLINLGISSYDPEKIIDRLDDTLFLISKKLVLVVEDIDRIMMSKHAAAQVQPLFDRLKNANNIRYILSVFRPIEGLDVEKLFNTRNDVFLNNDEIINTYKILAHCLIRTFNENKMIYPYGIENIEGIIDKNYLGSEVDKMEPTFIYSSNIVKTPRAIKRVFKEILDTWKILCGEIEIEDLISLISIKHSNYELYTSLINEEIYDNKIIKLEKKYKTENENEKKLLHILFENIKNKRQPILVKPNLDKFLLLKKEPFTDQDLLKLGNEYFLKQKNSKEVAEIIDEKNLYERVLPLWGKYIYRDKESDNSKVNETSQEMYEITKVLIFEIFDIIFNKKDQSDHFLAFNLISKILKITLNSKENINERELEINKKLFDYHKTTNGLSKVISFYFLYSNICFVNALNFIEIFRDENSKDPSVIQEIIKNENFDTIFEFLFHLPVLRRSESDQSEHTIGVHLDGNGIFSFDRSIIGWFLDCILDLAENGNEKARLILFRIVVKQIDVLRETFVGKINYSDDAINDRARFSQKFEELIKMLYPESFIKFQRFLKNNISDQIIKDILEVYISPFYQSDKIRNTFSEINVAIPSIENKNMQIEFSSWFNNKGFEYLDDRLIRSDITFGYPDRESLEQRVRDASTTLFKNKDFKEIKSDMMFRDKKNEIVAICRAIFVTTEYIDEEKENKVISELFIFINELRKRRIKPTLYIGINDEKIANKWIGKGFLSKENSDYESFFGYKTHFVVSKLSEYNWVIHNIPEPEEITNQDFEPNIEPEKQ
jgi:hypothetical protein